ncbi:MAG TPA: hypothetical protein VM733_22535 [Thermoanaerobaculia bacterium]|nr:hypothetical protein [Thermoanaerobaculia bacterium]
MLVLAAAIAVSAWALVRYAWEPVRCNAVVSQVEADTIAAEQLPDPYARTLRAKRNLARLEPLRCASEVRVPVLVASNEELMEHFEEAARHYEDALRMEQRPEIYLALGNVQVRLGRIDAAVENYARGVKFHPPMIFEVPSDEVRRRTADRLHLPQ